MNHDRAIEVQKRDGKLGKPFTKGVSGNPSGRPKGNPAVRELLKANSVEAAKALVGLLYSEKEQIRFIAAQEILNRTEGKPMQAVNMEVNGNMDIRSQIRAVLLERLNEEIRNDEQGIEDAD